MQNFLEIIKLIRVEEDNFSRFIYAIDFFLENLSTAYVFTRKRLNFMAFFRRIQSLQIIG